MIVAGRVSQKMAPVLRQIYDQMPEPKWVLSMGVCASSGGMFNNYAIVQGVDHIVPVDMYLPGCPPRPEMLIDAILKLHDKIMARAAGRPAPQGDRGADRARRAAGRGARRDAVELPVRQGQARRVEQGRRRRAARSSCASEKWMEERARLSAGATDAARQLGGARAAYRPPRRRSARPTGAPADFPPSTAAGRGMFGVSGSGDTSASVVWSAGGRAVVLDSPRPYGGYFDEVVDALEEAYPGFDDAIERVVVDRGELTLHIVPERIAEVARPCATTRRCASSCCSVGVRRRLPRLRRPPAARGLPPDLDDLPPPDPAGGRGDRRGPAPAERHRDLPDRRLAGAGDLRHVRRRSSTATPNLTRILMPDDWEGYPQRKDYPLGGVPVEYKGAEIPPPDQRRSYQ